MKFNTSYRLNAVDNSAVDDLELCKTCVANLDALSVAIEEYVQLVKSANCTYNYSDDLDENPLVYTDESFKSFLSTALNKVTTLTEKAMNGIRNLFSGNRTVVPKLENMPHITKVLDPYNSKEYNRLVGKLNSALKGDRTLFYKIKAFFKGSVAFYGLSYDDSRDITSDILNIFTNFNSTEIKSNGTTLLSENLYKMRRELSIAATWDLDKAKEISKQLSAIQNKWEYSVKDTCDKIINRVNALHRDAATAKSKKDKDSTLSKLTDYAFQTNSDQLTKDTIQLRIAAICFQYAELVKKSVNSYLNVADNLLGAIEKEEREVASAAAYNEQQNNNNNWD